MAKKIIEIKNVSKSYGDNFALVSIPENHFVESSDYIEFIQKKSDYQALDGFKIQKVNELNLEETKGSYEVILMNESQLLKNISINIENVNGWKVVENNLFIKEVMWLTSLALSKFLDFFLYHV